MIRLVLVGENIGRCDRKALLPLKERKLDYSVPATDWTLSSVRHSKMKKLYGQQPSVKWINLA